MLIWELSYSPRRWHGRDAGVTSALIACLSLFVLFSALGCDDHSSTAAAPPAPVKVAHAGTITGRVIFAGAVPQLPRITVSADPHCMQHHPDGIPDESVVIAGDGAMANVFVYLKDAPPSNGSAATPALIDQVNCQYVPHAVGVQINQPLRIKSSDPVFHNVHVLGEKNPPQNLSSIAQSEETIHFSAPEFLHVRCDVHPWMKAVVGVFANTYFAVTGTDGKFTIDNIPPGTYTLAAWHERFGELSKKITVAPDGTVNEALTYAK